MGCVFKSCRNIGRKGGNILAAVEVIGYSREAVVEVLGVQSNPSTDVRDTCERCLVNLTVKQVTREETEKGKRMLMSHAEICRKVEEKRSKFKYFAAPLVPQ